MGPLTGFLGPAPRPRLSPKLRAKTLKSKLLDIDVRKGGPCVQADKFILLAVWEMPNKFK